MKKPIILHLWSGDHRDPENARRMSVARRSWGAASVQYGEWIECDMSDVGLFNRNSSSVGDPASLPFIHDMVNLGIHLHPDAEIILITNADVGIFLGFGQECADLCAAHGACFSHRWDFPSLTDPLQTKEDIAKGKWYVGSDVFAFTKKWWAENNQKLPPFILGRETWDWVMRELIRETGGQEIHQGVFHEKHASPWKKGRLYHPGNLYNRSYARAWLLSRKMPLREITNAPFNEVAWPPVQWVKKEAAPAPNAIDVLIVLGTGSKWGNTELRYCLRSLEKHAKNLGKIWLAGYNPGFLSDKVGFLEVRDTPHNKEAKIAEAIFMACQKLPMTENFLWINDDTFLLKDTDIASYPYYADGGLDAKVRRTKPGGYRVALAQADAQLQSKKHMTHNFEVHVPIRYSRQKFIGLLPWIQLSAKCPLGITFRSVYCNALGIRPDQQYKDMKLGSVQTAEEFAALVKDRHCVSIGDGLGDGAKQYLHSLFPNPSIYEAPNATV